MRLQPLLVLEEFVSEVGDLVRDRLLVVVTADHGEEFWEHADMEARYFFNPLDSAQGLQLYVNGRYGACSELLAQLAFYNVIKEGSIVVDVGEHYGFYTLLATRKVKDKGAVLSFEPSKENFRVLRVNVAINKLNNVRPLNIALGDREEIGIPGVPRNARSGENTLAMDLHQAKYIEKVDIRRFD